MLKQGTLPPIPQALNARVLIAALCATGALFILLEPSLPTAGSTVGIPASAPTTDTFTSPLQPAPAAQSPLPTPTPSSNTLPKVASVSPRRGATDVSPDAPLTIEFEEEIDWSAIQSSLVIVPKVYGEYVWGSRSLTFRPTGG
jgi:hypothetical protein